MKKYHAEEGLVEVESGWSGSDMDVYLASDVDSLVVEKGARIAELEAALRMIANSGVDERGRDRDTLTIGEARSIALVVLGITF